MKRLLYILLFLPLGISLSLQGQPISHNGSIVSHQDQKVSVGAEAAPTCDDGMLSNGCFDSGTGWALDTEFTISGGTLNNDGTAASFVRQTDANMDATIQATTAYTFTYDLTLTTASYISVFVYDYSGTIYYEATHSQYSTATGITLGFTTPASVGSAGLRVDTQCDGTFSLDNFNLTAD